MANMHEPLPGGDHSGTQAQGAGPQAAGESLGYETRDANLRAILWLAVSITAMVLAAHLLLWVLLRALEAVEGRLAEAA